MTVLDLDGEAALLEAVAAPGTVLVDCWAAWCGPCAVFSPVFEGVAEAHPEVRFAKLDTDANQEVARRLAIQSIPTILGFRDGTLVFRQAGALPAPLLERIVAEMSALDMDEVRRAGAAHRDGVGPDDPGDPVRIPS